MNPAHLNDDPCDDWSRGPLTKLNRSVAMRKTRYSGDMTEADYDAACAFARDLGFVSTGRIQRHLGIGFNAAARLVEWMEERGFCARVDSLGRRTLVQ